jgi:RNA polymerase sigma-70 factor, ECF subfamily
MPDTDLEHLYDEHAQSLFGFVLNLTRNEADTADILQEIFCRLAQKPRILRGVGNVRAFLLQMAYRMVIDASRRQSVRSRHAETVAEVPVFAESEDPDETAFRQALAAAMADLPADQRAVVHLKLWEGMTFDAIAAALDIPANTAASRYRYGLDKLRTLLRPIYEEIL